MLALLPTFQRLTPACRSQGFTYGERSRSTLPVSYRRQKNVKQIRILCADLRKRVGTQKFVLGAHGNSRSQSLRRNPSVHCRGRQVYVRAADENRSGDDEHQKKDEVSNTSSRENKAPVRKREPRPQKPTHFWEWLTSVLHPATLLRFVLQILLLLGISRMLGIGMTGRSAANPPPKIIQVPYSDFIRKVQHNEVSNVIIDNGAISWDPHPRLNKRSAESEPQKAYSTIRPSDMTTPYDVMLSNGVQFGSPDRRAGGRFMTFLLTLLYISVLVGMLGRLPMLRPPQRGAGRQRGGRRGGDLTQPAVKFEDVAGVDEAKAELEEIVEYLRNPDRFTALGAQPPTGVLLVGAPGTGKTLLAKAVAGEADVPFISVSASEFVELYVGMGAARVREIFSRAKSQSPAIVFIDEIDAVAKGRGDGRLRGVGNDEREQTLNQLLTELDGFESDNLVICLAATNRPDTLDPALRRPGRFDRIVSVERPDKQGREEILQVHINNRGLPLAEEVSLEEIAKGTIGFTGAELANLVNEAALLAGRRELTEVHQSEFEDSIMRIVAGIEKKRSLLGPKERPIVARHEVGHAIVGSAVARIVAGAPVVEKVSIVARSGGALGFTYFPPPEERMLIFADELGGQLATLLGGRAAEEVACGRVSSGASDDIKRATSLAYRAITELGLSHKIGPLSLPALSAGEEDSLLLRQGGSNLEQAAEKEVTLLINRALLVAKEVVEMNLGLLEEIAVHLEEFEHIEGEALYKYLDRTEIPPMLEDFVNSKHVWSS